MSCDRGAETVSLQPGEIGFECARPPIQRRLICRRLRVVREHRAEAVQIPGHRQARRRGEPPAPAMLRSAQTCFLLSRQVSSTLLVAASHRNAQCRFDSSSNADVCRCLSRGQRSLGASCEARLPTRPDFCGAGRTPQPGRRNESAGLSSRVLVGSRVRATHEPRRSVDALVRRFSQSLRRRAAGRYVSR